MRTKRSGTSGIGNYTIKALVSTGASLRIYVIGRTSSEPRMQVFIQELHAINPKADVIWITGEISLLVETTRICSTIKTKESRVDLLFLTAGYGPWGTGRRETSEGIEITQSLSYYSRVNSINLDDLDLRKSRNFTGMNAQAQWAAMNTMALEKLAIDHPHITFIHSWPGWVDTGNVRRGQEGSWSLWAWFVWLVLGPVLSIISFGEEKTGQRHLYQCTSPMFEEKEKNSVVLVNYRCEVTPNEEVMATLRQTAMNRVWEHTRDVLKPYL
ncbi:hypothetical protein P280DRAFT_74663 [Massarina eburnea CBS 473.64]|uniref:NAD(P)-binding protein n=1 Tax=Massarina eburnea CBS 473.64 TaxID=1395130 RepID=A0A6A6RWM8_9PLEO|nr:hypothetical protein P280DRAFT_74663 [Massarina eburnea CBS 473.64]